MLGIIEKSGIVILVCLHIASAYDCFSDLRCTHCASDNIKCAECGVDIPPKYHLVNGECQDGPPPPAPPPQSNCLSGSSMVTTPTGSVAMETINIGDSVLTVLTNEEVGFTKVVGFAQREPEKDAQFMSITAVNHAGHTHTVKLTNTHNIYVKTKNDEYIPGFAEDVSIGDVLKTQTNNGTAVNEATVTHVTLHKEIGAFAPLTETGTMLVDGTLVSCYASFNDYLVHLVLAPIRWFPWLFADSEKPLDGRLPYVEAMKYIGRSYIAPVTSLE